jgi:hypothetical protein
MYFNWLLTRLKTSSRGSDISLLIYGRAGGLLNIYIPSLPRPFAFAALLESTDASNLAAACQSRSLAAADTARHSDCACISPEPRASPCNVRNSVGTIQACYPMVSTSVPRFAVNSFRVLPLAGGDLILARKDATVSYQMLYRQRALAHLKKGKFRAVEM